MTDGPERLGKDLDTPEADVGSVPHNRSHIVSIVLVVALLAIGLSAVATRILGGGAKPNALVSPISRSTARRIQAKTSSKVVTGGSIESPPTVSLPRGLAPAEKLPLAGSSGSPQSTRASTGGTTTAVFGGKQDKPYVLVFMAAWCIECHVADRTAETVYKETSPKVDFVGIDVGDSSQAAASFISQEHITFPVGLDQSQGFAQKYGVYGLPQTFFIRANGTIEDHTYGPMTSSGLLSEIQALTRSN